MATTSWSAVSFADTDWTSDILPDCIFGYRMCDILSAPFLPMCEMLPGAGECQGAVPMCEWGNNCTKYTPPEFATTPWSDNILDQ